MSHETNIQYIESLLEEIEEAKIAKLIELADFTVEDALREPGFIAHCLRSSDLGIETARKIALGWLPAF